MPPNDGSVECETAASTKPQQFLHKATTLGP